MSDHDPSPSGENALRDALNDMDVALGAHGRTHVPVKTISDWIEHARQRVAALAAAPRDRTCAVCGRVETEDLNDPTRCRSRLLREGGSPFFDDLCLRAGPQLRAAAQRDRPQTDLQRLLGVMEEVSARLPDEDAPRDRPDARGPGFAQCWCGPGMAPDHEGPHLAASAPLAAPSAPTPEKQSPAPAAKMDDRLRQVRGWLDAIRIRCREGDPTTDWLPKIAEFADTGIAILDKQSAAASLEVEALDGEWLAAIDSWRKCSSKRLSWASGGHCSACGPLQKLMARAVLRRGGR